MSAGKAASLACIPSELRRAEGTPEEVWVRAAAHRRNREGAGRIALNAPSAGSPLYGGNSEMRAKPEPVDLRRELLPQSVIPDMGERLGSACDRSSARSDRKK